MTRLHLLRLATLTIVTSSVAAVVAVSGPVSVEPITVFKRSRVEEGGGWAVREQKETWDAQRTAVIVCDMWDAHHCLNAVRRVEDVAPRMNAFLNAARSRGALIIHAPSSCMEPYKNHAGRKLAQAAPKAANLPADISQWCRLIPAEEKGIYPIDQTDGGEDDDPIEHARWHERLAGMGRNPKSPWKAQTELLTIRDEDAISDSGVEIWNLMEQRGIRNVMLVGVHTNMCVLGRPFGLRQLAKNGKNVVLVRDLTDTMYNPEKWPYVTHFVGTDRIVEHVEKYVCPSITSVDLLGGEPFRFKNDRRNLLFVIGEDEYKTDVTLPEFAKAELEPRGFQVRVVHSDKADPNTFPGLADAVQNADLVFVSIRRRTLPPGQLDAVRAHVAAGKPLIGIRTASHAFAARGNAKVPDGRAVWTGFDPEVLGGRYTGHHGNGPKTALTAAPGAKDHPALRGVDLGRLVGNGSLYRVAPLMATTTPLLLGTTPDKPVEPVAWTNQPRSGGGRVFYTSLGHPDDFANPAFRKLLLNGICWSLDVATPGNGPAR